MGAGRQKLIATEIFEYSVHSGLGERIRQSFPENWLAYKNTLQTTYCKRMSLMVPLSNQQWSKLWSLSIKFVGVDLHKGSGLVNSLLKIEEAAFKSLDNNRRYI